jgi:hypothetical protein
MVSLLVGSETRETEMTKIALKLSKNGFYFGSVEKTYPSFEAACGSKLVEHYAAQGISVVELQFIKA